MKRSKFNLSHYHLATHDMGQLVPVGITEVLPGDTVQHGVSVLVRASPLATPPMHPVRYKVHHWFVPHRVIWPDFEKFITGGPDGMDASVFPTITLSNVQVGSLADYLGVPVGFSGAVSALPFRVYAKVFNENYRDQDLVALIAMAESSGPDAVTSTALLSAAWDKDYFTTARPWEQKGPSITLPIGTSAPVKFNITGATPAVGQTISSVMTGTSPVVTQFSMSGTVPATTNAPASVYADLTAATAVDINQVREAFALQRYQEARARYGSRYTEYLAFLGVRSSDARLQRPEYLGGGKTTLQFSEVLQTAQTEDSPDGVGSLYGHGIAGMRSNRYRKFFEEHGYIISVAQCLPVTMYPQGLFRHWNRRVKEDFWQRELQHIGQQAVLNKEVYALGGTPDGQFGFQDRYDEYRRTESQVHGEFRTLLNDWHFARLFSAQPVLNGSFVTADPAKRPFQSQSTNVLYAAVQHQMVARRMVAAKGSSFIF